MHGRSKSSERELGRAIRGAMRSGLQPVQAAIAADCTITVTLDDHGASKDGDGLEAADQARLARNAMERTATAKKGAA